MRTPSVKATNVLLSDEVRDYAEKKCTAACDAFILDNPTAVAAAELEHAAVRDGEKYRAEFTVQVNGDVYRAESWGQSLYAAIDGAAQKLTHELARRKGKKERTGRKFLRQIKDFLRGA